MPFEYVWKPAPKDMSVPCSQEMPDGFVENYVWSFIRQIRAASNGKYESAYFVTPKSVMVGLQVSLWKMKNTRYYRAEMERRTIAAVVVVKSASLTEDHKVLFLVVYFIKEEDESKSEDCFRM